MNLNFFRKNKSQHTISSFKNKKWVYISYIPEVFQKKNDARYMLAHQNRREQIIISKIFQKLGYNIKIAFYESQKECDDRLYDIIFGLEPNFVTMCKKNPKALKIYYATGANWVNRNKMIKERTDSFNIKNNTDIEYTRLVDPHEGYQIADHIIQIGSSYTVRTYPIDLRDKIKTINQSSNFIGKCNLKRKINEASQKEFMWFGSSGSILKGLDLVLDCFINKPEYKLHVVGPIDEKFKNHYDQILKRHNNIHLYGFLDTTSETFLNLAYRCAFNIFPSASEGGSPGSVITMMKLGVIPIVSKWAAFDTIQNYGYLLNDLTTTSIEKAIEWSSSLTTSELEDLIKRNISHSEQTWNLSNFEKEMQTLLEKYIEDHIKK